MASNRMISTGIWSDERFTDLSPAAQLVYFRLVLGDDTTAAGATEVRAKRIAVDTNLERAEVERAVDELVGCDLLRRYESWLWMPAWIRYQVHGTRFILAARRASKGCPDALRKAIGRAIDAHLDPGNGPKNGKTSENTSRRSPDRTRTEKNATSRENVEGYPNPQQSLSNASPDPSRAVSGPEPLSPYGGGVRTGTGDDEPPLGPGGPGAHRLDIDAVLDEAAGTSDVLAEVRQRRKLRGVTRRGAA